tara:strand:+ start:442 stop:1437 length:996 start_codon:yes stop_codon:yes gene_type:complete
MTKENFKYNGDVFQPNIEGGEIIDIKYADMTTVLTKDDQGLKDRLLDEDTVKQFCGIIKRDALIYEKKTGNVAPTAKWCNKLKKYLIITGEHKTQAHLRLEKDKILILVVEFHKHKGKPAEYWEQIWMSNENNPFSDNFARNKRKPEEIENSFVRMYKSGLLKNNKDDIEKALIDAKVEKHKRDGLIADIMSAISDGKDGKTPTQYSKKGSAEEAIKKMFGTKCEKISTENRITICEGNNIFISQLFTEVDNRDYDSRVTTTLKNIYKRHKDEVKDLKIHLIGHVHHHDRQHIENVQNSKGEHLYKEMEGWVSDEAIQWLKEHLEISWLNQ